MGLVGSISGQASLIPHAAEQLSLHATTKTRHSLINKLFFLSFFFFKEELWGLGQPPCPHAVLNREMVSAFAAMEV